MNNFGLNLLITSKRYSSAVCPSSFWYFSVLDIGFYIGFGTSFSTYFDSSYVIVIDSSLTSYETETSALIGSADLLFFLLFILTLLLLAFMLYF